MDWGKRHYFYSSFSLASTQMTSLTAKNMHWIRISLIPWICSKNTQHITQPAVHLFDLIRSKFFANCLKVFVSRVSVLLHWSVEKFSSAVFPFDCICAKFVFIRASVRTILFERLGYPFLILVLAVRSLVVRIFLRNVFAWEVTYLLLLLLCRSMKLWNAVHIMSSIGRMA